MGLSTCVSYDTADGYCSVLEGGGAEGEALLAGPAGIDAPPVPGDTLVTVSDGRGGQVVVAAFDNLQKGKAGAGEIRIYSRTALGGVELASLYLKGNGGIALQALADVEVTTIGAAKLTAATAEVTAASVSIVGNVSVTGNLTVTGTVSAVGPVSSAASVAAPAVAAGALGVAGVPFPPTLATHTHDVTGSSATGGAVTGSTGMPK